MMRLFNSLHKKKEEVVGEKLGMYTCGPTVYSYVSIGNWRTYVLSDLLVRSLRYFGKEVDLVMNITDVGHLTGDNAGDADTGEDRLLLAAKKERKTAWEVADFYTKDFLRGFKKMNLLEPRVFSKATDHIGEQIKLVERIEKQGFTYKTSDGVYFDVAEYEEAGNNYGELSTLDEVREGARVKKNPEKKDPRDFALWKFSKKGENRDMEWESPWGMGFPGWHIECSAMGMKYLGEQFDLHVGGEDLRSTHHPNEIAQAEAATGRKPFVKYWVHGAFLRVDGKRMGKSLGNAYNLGDIEKKGFSPLDLRYFFLTGHYRKPLNFTWEALEGAQRARSRLVIAVRSFKEADLEVSEKERDEFRQKFVKAIEDDLNMPQALAVVRGVVKSGLDDKSRKTLVLEFDEILGLDLGRRAKIEDVPEEVMLLVMDREQLRRAKKWQEADEVRREIEEMGYEVKDAPKGARVVKSNS